MTKKQFKILRLLIVIFVSISVSVAYSIENFILAIAAVLVGMLFMFLVKKKAGQLQKVDERIISISGRSSRITYVIFTISMAFASLILMFYGRSHENYFYESLGTVMSYAVMANLVIYSLAFHYYNRKYGGDK